MTQFHSDPMRESDPAALPDCEVFELTDREFAEDVYEYGTGGWFWCYWPDNDGIDGPYETREAAIEAAREEARCHGHRGWNGADR